MQSSDNDRLTNGESALHVKGFALRYEESRVLKKPHTRGCRNRADVRLNEILPRPSHFHSPSRTLPLALSAGLSRARNLGLFPSGILPEHVLFSPKFLVFTLFICGVLQKKKKPLSLNLSSCTYTPVVVRTPDGQVRDISRNEPR